MQFAGVYVPAEIVVGPLVAVAESRVLALRGARARVRAHVGRGRGVVVNNLENNQCTAN